MGRAGRAVGGPSSVWWPEEQGTWGGGGSPEVYFCFCPSGLEGEPQKE